MAEVPATTTSAFGGPQSGVVSGFNRLGILRQIGLMIGLAASVAIGFSVVLWSQEPDYRPLMNDLNSQDANQIIETLQANEIPYKIDASSGALLVAADAIHRARLKLAGEGLTGKSNVGFELLDQEQPLGTSQFMESTRYRRGLEGELARTISSLLAVKSARVHLALPKQSVFVRDSRTPTASVFVELYSGRQLDKAQVSSIANMVASSIPSLNAKNVTVVDQKGRLLNSQDVDEDVTMAAKQLEYTRKLEERLAGRVRGILEPVVGLGRFKAEVSADVDFTSVEQTDELFNPDLPSLRSEQTLIEQRVGGGGAQGVPGALSNQPPGVATVPENAIGAGGAGGGGGNGSSRNQATRNFELDRTISYTRHQQGRLRRLTVAVAVDDLVVVDAEGGRSSRPWSETDVQRLTLLVRDAVGYSAQRGDSVNVINTAFAAPDAIEEVPELALWEQSWFMDLMKQVGAGLFLLILVFGVLRPILKNLASVGNPDQAGGEGGELAGIEDSGFGDDEELGVDDSALLPGPNESYDRQLDAIRSLVSNDPGRVAQVIKQWVTADE